MHNLPKLTFSAILALFVTNVFAQNEDCNAILIGDLTNKILSSSTDARSSSEMLRQQIFTKEEDEAFAIYDREYKNAIKQSQSGGVELNVALWGGKGEFAASYERELTGKDFSQAYNKKKNEYKSDVSQMKSTTTALASSYASYIRDPNTIEAWKACVTRNETPGLYAFGSRDESGTPFINVVWAPGYFAGESPSIEVMFVPPRGAKIATARPKVEVALGSGESFLVETPKPNAGFMVQVNGRRMKGEKIMNSFTAKAEIPPFPPPKPKDPIATPVKQEPVAKPRTETPIKCSVFDDGYSKMSESADAIYIAGPNEACVPGGSHGVCRRWFGRCTTTGENPRNVKFKVFDDGDRNQTQLSDAVYINAPNVSCIPGGPVGDCRRWFGLPETDAGEKAQCYLFDDGYTNRIGPTNAIFYKDREKVCMPGGESGVCRRWFGQCVVVGGN
jgi:hypothetical protein